MKRFSAFILALVMCLGLAACGTKGDNTDNTNGGSNAGASEDMDDSLNPYFDSKKPSTAEVPSDYIALDAAKFFKDNNSEEALKEAIPSYLGNAYEMTLDIDEVHENYIVSGNVWGTNKDGEPEGYTCMAFMIVYLSDEDIKGLKEDDKITVIGVIDEIDTDTYDENGMRVGLYRIALDSAYGIYDKRQAFVVTPAKLVK